MTRLDKVSPFLVMDILKRAQSLRDVVHMEIGEPDLEPSPRVIQALLKSSKDRKFSYTPSLGLPELRERIAQHYYDYYGVEVSPSRVVITTGTSSAFLILYAMLTDSGDSILISDPSYPCYRNFAYLLKTGVVSVGVDKSTRYQVTVDHLKSLSGYVALHISSPANPTGILYEGENLQALAQVCEEKRLHLICDEIYHGLVYDQRERTALEFSDRAIVVNGFSKAFCMPGLRLGWIVLPDEDMVRRAEIIMQNLYISAPSVSQYAALEAFDYEHLSKVREIYRRRRDMLVNELKGVGNLEFIPDGAFYLWLDVSSFTHDSYELSIRLLEDAGVAVTPGVDFGKNQTNRYIRLSFAKDGGTLSEGARRIRSYLTR